MEKRRMNLNWRGVIGRRPRRRFVTTGAHCASHPIGGIFERVWRLIVMASTRLRSEYSEYSSRFLLFI
jgi:hypothetical protein